MTGRRRLPMVVAAVLAVGVTVAAVDAVRDATLSVHDPRPPGSVIELEVHARAKGNERGQVLDELVHAVVLSCRLEVRSDLVGPIRHEGGGRFVARLQPSMDRSNQRQFRGCLEDWTVDHLMMDVMRLDEVRAG